MLTRTRHLPAALACVVAMLAVMSARAARAPDASQAISAPMEQRKIPGVLASFDFDQTTPTTDQITILFSNAAVDLRRPPTTPFGDGVVEQISFSGRDFPKPNSRVSFSKRVQSRSFLDCRYIRVVNAGTSPWAPTNISLRVDGQKVLDRVSMYPRKGVSAKGGIVRWNPADWRPVFWEAELFRYYHPSKAY